MFDFLILKLHDTKFLIMLLTSVAAVATVITLAMPLLSPDTLGRRMKSVALEREKIRQRERERLSRGEKDKVALRQSPKLYMQRAVEKLNLSKWLAQEAAREKLVQAGFRGQAPYIAFLFFRMVTPVVLFLLALFYMFVVVNLDQPPMIKIGLCLAAAYAGMQVPYFFLKNRSGIQEGQRGNRIAVRCARRRTDAHHCRIVIPSGPESCLRKPGQAYRP
jgi:tight adherence protein C